MNLSTVSTENFNAANDEFISFLLSDSTIVYTAVAGAYNGMMITPESCGSSLEKNVSIVSAAFKDKEKIKTVLDRHLHHREDTGYYALSAYSIRTYSRAVRIKHFYLRALEMSGDQRLNEIQSERNQNYPNWELVLADVLADRVVEKRLNATLVDPLIYCFAYDVFYYRKAWEKILSSLDVLLNDSDFRLALSNKSRSDLDRLNILSVAQLQATPLLKIISVLLFDCRPFFRELSDVFHIALISSQDSEPADAEFTTQLLRQEKESDKEKQVDKNNNSLSSSDDIDIDGDVTDSSIPALSFQNPVEIVSSIKNQLSERNKDRALEIFRKRNLGEAGQPQTLEKLGLQYGLTRERIRQIAKKVEKKLIYVVAGYNETTNNGYYAFLLSLFADGPIFSMERLQACLGCKEDAIIWSFSKDVLNECDFYGKHPAYSSTFGAYFLLSSNETIEQGINRHFSTYPASFNQNVYQNLSPLDQRLLDSAYRYDSKSQLYIVKSGRRGRGLIDDIVRESFPNGYRIYNDLDYQTLVSIWHAKFGDKSPAPSMVSVRGYCGANYQLCNEGAYLPPDMFPTMSPSLYAQAVTLAHQYMPAVYYVSLFGLLKNDAHAEGITNYWMFKGCFDALDKEFDHDRYYIKQVGWNGNIYECIHEVAKRMPSAFTCDDLRKYFPYAENFYFTFAFAKFSDVIQIDNESFLYVNDATFAASDIQILKEAITKILMMNDVPSMASDKLYRFLWNMYSELLERLRFITNGFSLRAVVREKLSADFDVTKNYVGRKGETAKNRYDAVMQIIEKHDKITADEIFADIRKNVVTTPISFEQIIDWAAPTHVQYARDTLYRATLFRFSEEQMQDVAHFLNLETINGWTIDTSNFDRYNALPMLGGGIQWNKWFLAGVTRTFFHDEYVVLYTTGDFRSTDFIIKRRS